MRVLVTGYQGYIGSVLIPYLLEANHEVIGLDNGLFRDCAYTDEQLRQPIPVIKKDIRDIDGEDLAGVQAIIHLAGISYHLPDEMRAQLLHEINYVAAVKLASLAKFSGVKRFIYLSSYDGAPGVDRIEEIEPLLATNPPHLNNYISRLVELDVARLADSAFCPTYFRCGDVYGYSPRLRLDLPINRIVASAVMSGDAYVRTNADVFRPGVHVNDVAQAITALVRVPHHIAARKAFSLGSAEMPLAAEDLGAILRDTLPRSSIRFVETGKAETETPRFHEMETVPGFEAKWNVSDGIEQLYEAYSTYPVTAEDISTERYNRLGRIRHLLREGRLDASLRLLDSGTFRRPTPTPAYMQKPNTSRIG